MSSSPLVQYVVVRGDLLLRMGWPVGAVLAQACHASVAAVHLFYQHENTQDYLRDIDNMRKVVLEAKDEPSLRALSDKLAEKGVDHKLWTEQPEDYPTCLALRPYPRDEVQRLFKKFKLYKGPEVVKPAAAEEKPKEEESKK